MARRPLEEQQLSVDHHQELSAVERIVLVGQRQASTGQPALVVVVVVKRHFVVRHSSLLSYSATALGLSQVLPCCQKIRWNFSVRSCLIRQQIVVAEHTGFVLCGADSVPLKFVLQAAWVVLVSVSLVVVRVIGPVEVQIPAKSGWAQLGMVTRWRTYSQQMESPASALAKEYRERHSRV